MKTINTYINKLQREHLFIKLYVKKNINDRSFKNFKYLWLSVENLCRKEEKNSEEIYIKVKILKNFLFTDCFFNYSKFLAQANSPEEFEKGPRKLVNLAEDINKFCDKNLLEVTKYKLIDYI